MSSVSRRTLLGGVVDLSTLTNMPASESNIPYCPLGTTGEKVSLVGLGGFHLGLPHVAEADAIRIVRSALDQGVSFLDNSWDYNEGHSEIRVGKALRDGYRQKAFVMTKVDGRTKDSAAKQIDESLRRLQTDHIDLSHLLPRVTTSAL